MIYAKATFHEPIAATLELVTSYRSHVLAIHYKVLASLGNYRKRDLHKVSEC